MTFKNGDRTSIEKNCAVLIWFYINTHRLNRQYILREIAFEMFYYLIYED